VDWTRQQRPFLITGSRQPEKIRRRARSDFGTRGQNVIKLSSIQARLTAKSRARQPSTASFSWSPTHATLRSAMGQKPRFAGRSGTSVHPDERTPLGHETCRTHCQTVQANVLAEAASIRSIMCGGRLKRGSDSGPQCLDDSRPLRVRRIPATSRLDHRKPI
jgi:hypothetical protein